MSELPQQIQTGIQDPMPPTGKWLRTDCNDARVKMSNKCIKYHKQFKGIESLKDNA